SLLKEERRFGAALELLERVFATYTSEDPEIRDLHLAGRVLVNKANTLEQIGDVEQAIAVLREAAPLVVE
ncbi:MAG TPA: hypothetical protein VHB47_02750, partial [Thermoanaerobaculia bacterium]|nr:hypothetical protein [Thermoanaerobaculia bacterium]